MTRSLVLAAALAAAAVLSSSCAREKEVFQVPRVEVEEGGGALPETAGAPVRGGGVPEAVRILPAVAVRGTPLVLSAEGFLLEDALIRWLVGGTIAPGQESGTLETRELTKGETVQARVTVGERVLFSNKVTLSNTPPEIRSVRIVPETIRPGDSPGVEAEGSDPDGDPVTFEIAWQRDGLPAGSGSRMEGALKRGDVLSVRITPFDGEARGNYLVLRREVLNYPPEIRGVAESQLEGELYSCRVLASDGDGDPLTYVLNDAPAGMTIETSTGVIRWTVPAGFAGRVPVTVSVSDGHGGEGSYAMAVTIEAGTEE